MILKTDCSITLPTDSIKRKRTWRLPRHAIFFIIMACSFFTTSVVFQSQSQPPIKLPSPDVNIFPQMELDLIQEDLESYTHLSERSRKEIMSSISNTATKYNLPPLLLHVIIRIESNYRFNIDHPTVRIAVKGRLVTTCARGLGGIVWECWEDSLKKNDIAHTYADLYQPSVNISSMGFIIQSIMVARHSGLSSKNAIPVLVAAYYGASNQAYEYRVKEITSDMMMKYLSARLIKPKVE